jgi:hypothetical protein
MVIIFHKLKFKTLFLALKLIETFASAALAAATGEAAEMNMEIKFYKKTSSR